MNYFNSLIEGLTLPSTLSLRPIAMQLNSSYYKTLSYLYFDETSNEITRKMQVYQSNNDWFGVSLTLVVDKQWLTKLKDQFLTIIKLYQMSEDTEQSTDLPSQSQMITTHTQTQIVTQTTTTTAMPSPNSFSPNSEGSTYEEIIHDEFLTKLKLIIVLLDDIHLVNINFQYTELIRYFFSDDLFLTKSQDSGEYVIPKPGFLSDFVKSINHNPNRDQIKKTLNEIYTDETLNRIIQLYIMFGIFTPLLDFYQPLYHVVQNLIDNTQ